MVAQPSSNLGFQNFFQATLTSDITASSVDIPLDNIPNATEGFLVIDPDSPSGREVIFYDSKTALKVVCPSSADGRGQDDTTASAHSSGTTVIMAPVAGFFEALQSGAAFPSGIPITSPDAINWDGWVNPNEGWTYASASTFTVPGDQTSKYTSGTRLKFTQTTIKYGTVASSSHAAGTTTVTIIVNTDYILANAAITSPFYSYATNPQGYPTFFNYTAALTNVSGGTVGVSRFSVVGNRVKVEYRYSLGGAGITGSILVGAPVSINTSHHLTESTIGHGFMLDTGTQLYASIPIVGSSSSVQLRPINASASYSTFANNTSSTIPFTWGSGDQFGFSADYVMA